MLTRWLGSKLESLPNLLRVHRVCSKSIKKYLLKNQLVNDKWTRKLVWVNELTREFDNHIYNTVKELCCPHLLAKKFWTIVSNMVPLGQSTSLAFYLFLRNFLLQHQKIGESCLNVFYNHQFDLCIVAWNFFHFFITIFEFWCKINIRIFVPAFSDHFI